MIQHIPGDRNAVPDFFSRAGNDGGQSKNVEKNREELDRYLAKSVDVKNKGRDLLAFMENQAAEENYYRLEPTWEKMWAHIVTGGGSKLPRWMRRQAHMYTVVNGPMFGHKDGHLTLVPRTSNRKTVIRTMHGKRC